MTQKIKIEVIKKQPKGVVRIFGNVQNKVGTYDRKKVEQFKKKLMERSLELGEKILCVIDDVDELMFTAASDFIDKMVHSYEEHKKGKNASFDNVESQVSENDEQISISPIIPTRRINFDDLEPLGQIIDGEDNVQELQELKMELLFRKQDEERIMESDGIRKK